MRILLDEDLPRRLGTLLTGSTALQSDGKNLNVWKACVEGYYTR